MHSFDLDDGAYNELLNLLNNQHFVEQPGVLEDMEFLSDDWWLRDTAATENIVKRNLMWEIQLVFAHYLQPWKLIKRNIARYSCRNKAELNAWYIRHLAARDQQGTLKVNLDDFRLCPG